MEGQITIFQWQEWKEDIRKKLQETAGNFVYIGYRLKQIRDSGMYGDAKDIFEFAKLEYGLGRSMVQRFIAINEKFSVDGNSLELREEFASLGSSKLSEMLTLSESECMLITERTTVREIRDLKEFTRQEHTEELEGGEKKLTPLQKCIVDFFSSKEKREILNMIIDLMKDDCLATADIKKIVEVINPSDYATHKKGTVFLFMYGFSQGIKYKQVVEPAPIEMSWLDFLRETFAIYEDNIIYGYDVWVDYYGEPVEEEKVEEKPIKTEKELCATSHKKEEKPVSKPIKKEPLEEEEDENEEEETDEEENQENMEDDIEPERVTKGQERIRNLFEGDEKEDIKEEYEENQEDPEEDDVKEDKVAAVIEPSYSVNTEKEPCATSHKIEMENASVREIFKQEFEFTKMNMTKTMDEFEALIRKELFFNKKANVIVKIEVEDEE